VMPSAAAISAIRTRWSAVSCTVVLVTAYRQVVGSVA
jgi:hypothetical protein